MVLSSIGTIFMMPSAMRVMAFRPRIRSYPSALCASPVWYASQQSSSTPFTMALLPSGIHSYAQISASNPPTPPRRYYRPIRR